MEVQVECGDNYAKMEIISELTVTDLNTTQFAIASFVLIWAWYPCNCAYTFKCNTLLTMETHLELRCQFHLMLFLCSNFFFQSCLQCCDLTSMITSSGLNGNEHAGKQTVYKYAYIYIYRCVCVCVCVCTYMVYKVVQELRNLFIWGMSNTCVHFTRHII